MPYEITHATDVPKRVARRLYREWREGRSKNDIERKEFNDPYSHGKLATKIFREVLGIETEETHPMVKENRRLRRILIRNGINPKTGLRRKRSG